MSTAHASLRVVHAGPLVTMQDAGRFGRLRFGIAGSGPMDRLAHAAANAAVGNDRRATAIEVSRAGATFECGALPVTVSVCGGGAVVECAGERLGSWSVVTMTPGDRLSITAGEWGSWTYLAVAGTLDATRWLGSASTHSIAGLGGGALRSGQVVPIIEPRVDADRDGSLASALDVVSGAAHRSAPIRVVLGPQEHRFVAEAGDVLLASRYTLTDAYDRMGMRLDGAALLHRDALSIPSEPIVRGSIQVAGDGVPTVLLADHQTTGGYPKIATVVSSDLDRLVQHRPSDTIRFEAITPTEAIDAARRYARVVDATLEEVGRSGRNFAARLLREDLIGDTAAPVADVEG